MFVNAFEKIGRRKGYYIYELDLEGHISVPK